MPTALKWILISAGVVLIAAAHARGWPIAAGGAQSISDALAACLQQFGGRIHTERWITSLAELDEEIVARLTLFLQRRAVQQSPKPG